MYVDVNWYLMLSASHINILITNISYWYIRQYSLDIKSSATAPKFG